MALDNIQQLQQLLEKSKYILLVFTSKDSGDAVASSLALKLFLEKNHRQVDMASDGFKIQKNLKFLPQIEHIKSELSHLQKFIIKVDVSKAPIETISYDVKENWLSVYLTPKQGTITKNELRTAQSTFKYDLIITLNSPDLESLGEIFLNNTDLFYRTPLINIDYHPANEHYGQINLVDLTAACTAEIVYQILKQLQEADLDTPIATALLTGMILATKSFKTHNITPQTLNIASDLIKLGGERETIVRHLYQTHSLTTLKLWGQVLTHLQNESALGLVSATITREDFARSGATADDLRGLVDEIIGNAPEANIILLLYELERPGEPSLIQGLITVEKNYNALEITKPFNPKGDKKQASFTLSNKTLKEAEQEVIKTIETLKSKVT